MNTVAQQLIPFASRFSDVSGGRKVAVMRDWIEQRLDRTAAGLRRWRQHRRHDSRRYLPRSAWSLPRLCALDGRPLSRRPHSRADRQRLCALGRSAGFSYRGRSLPRRGLAPDRSDRNGHGGNHGGHGRGTRCNRCGLSDDVQRRGTATPDRRCPADGIKGQPWSGLRSEPGDCCVFCPSGFDHCFGAAVSETVEGLHPDIASRVVHLRQVPTVGLVREVVDSRIQGQSFGGSPGHEDMHQVVPGRRPDRERTVGDPVLGPGSGSAVHRSRDRGRATVRRLPIPGGHPEYFPAARRDTDYRRAGQSPPLPRRNPGDRSAAPAPVDEPGIRPN